MIDDLAPTDLETFRRALVTEIGLRFDDDKLPLLTEVLRQRIVATRSGSVGAYLGGTFTTADELGEVARRLTVSETYFLRNIEQFRVLEALIRHRAQQGARFLRILSAGCSTGEEAYSLAITVRQAVGRLDDWSVSIVAFDLNPAVLEIAATAHYRAWSLRDTSDEVQRTWFQQRAGTFALDEAVHRMVRFEQRNLARPDPSFWVPGRFDIVFCRNVLMYFDPEQTREAVGRIARSLAPGGLLFLGAAESLRGISDDFHLRNTHGTFYYERRSGGPSFELPPEAPPQVLPIAVDDRSWFDAIARSSTRIEELSRPRAAAPPLAVPPRPRVAAAMALMQQERFDEALSSLDPAADDAEGLLLRAALLVVTGDGAAAEATCLRLLAKHGLHAGAHYVMALCREQEGDGPSAVAHNRAAIDLDPGFSMAHLHLGLLARRSGDLGTARRELTLALDLLAREEPSRIVLFGGGFDRDGLMGVCRGELAACGGPR